jgi:Protein of unknown function (DUF2752)
MSAVRILAPSGMLAALRAIPPPGGIDLCGFHRLTHLPCPLCGLTHALFALMKGHWNEALRLHALSPLALAMLLAAFWEHPVRNRVWTIGLAAFAVYGVARMLAAR